MNNSETKYKGWVITQIANYYTIYPPGSGGCIDWSFGSIKAAKTAIDTIIKSAAKNKKSKAAKKGD